MEELTYILKKIGWWFIGNVPLYFWFAMMEKTLDVTLWTYDTRAGVIILSIIVSISVVVWDKDF